MGFFARALAWTLGAAAVVVAGFVVYNAFFGAPEKRVIAAAARVCPPAVSLAPRAPGAPADDVVGVRLGFTVKDAQETLLCRDESFKFDFEQIWHTPLPAGTASRQRMFATRPQERIALGLVGQREREIVQAVFQDIRYGETVVTITPDAAVATLTRRYGKPHERKTAGGGRIDLWWLYGADGKAIAPGAAPGGADPLTAITAWITDSWKAGDCKRHVSLSPIEPARWSSQCGLTIHAEIETRKEDPTRIARYRIVAVNQARLGGAVSAYRERISAQSPT